MAKMNELKAFIDGYIDCLEKNLSLRLEPKTDCDWYFGEASSVIGSLLARQITLTMHLAMSPNCWNGHVAPLFLRSMIDAHISLAWILKDPNQRSKEYISYALGQEKLSKGHLKRKFEKDPQDDRLISMIESKSEWINNHMLMSLVEVNLGSWSGSSVRQMCIDINDEDFYNFSFSPFSACVHNNWYHLNLYNSWPCENPLHKNHFMPNILERPIDIDFLFRSGKYASMSLKAFDNALGLEIDCTPPKDWILENEVHTEAE